MADRLQLARKHREVLEALLREHLPDVEVWAYGSRVSGKNHDGSDLDLVLRGPGLKEIPFGKLGDFEEAVRESTIPFLVEARDWARLPEGFHWEIERDHEVLSLETRECDSAREDQGAHSPSEIWCETSLGELLSFQNGKRSPERNDELPYPIFGSNGVIGHADKVNAPAKTTVIGRVGSYCGSLHYSEKPCWVTDNAIQANALGLNDSKFLYYLLSTLRLHDRRHGSGQPLLNQSILSSIPAVVPPPAKQRAIVHVLGTLDDKIELNRRMNETLEAMAHTLFKSWFFDFAPVRAKMEGRDTGLPKQFADLFPDRLVDSEIGEIPEGWSIYRLNDLAVHHTHSMTPASQPAVLFEHFSIPAYDRGQMPKIERGKEIKSNKTAIPPGSVLLSKLNPEIPRVWLPSMSFTGPQICSTEFLVFTPKRPSSRSLLFSLFTNGTFRTLLRSMVTGTSKSHQRVPPTALKQCEVLSGMPLVFDKFEELVATMLENVVAKRDETQTLVELRDALLPRLISGEIRLNDAERYVEAVL